MEVVSLIASKALNESQSPVRQSLIFLYLRCWHLISKEFSLGSLAPECSRPLEALAESSIGEERVWQTFIASRLCLLGDSGVGLGRVEGEAVCCNPQLILRLYALRSTALLRGARNIQAWRQQWLPAAKNPL